MELDFGFDFCFKLNENGSVFIDFLDNQLPLLLEDVPLETRQNLYFSWIVVHYILLLLCESILMRYFNGTGLEEDVYFHGLLVYQT